jgi:energy-coupling factor transporter ATP-binding protein EcfA2
MVLPTDIKSGSRISVPKKKPIPESVTETASHNALVTPDNPVILDASPVPTGVGSSGASGKSENSSAVDTSNADNPDNPESTDQALVTSSHLPASALSELSFFMGDDGNAYIKVADENNSSALRIGGKQADHLLLRLAHRSGMRLKRNDVRDINDELTAHAELYGDNCDVWYRVAPFQNGIELDVGDKSQARIRVTPGNVEIITEGSETLFYRTPGMRPFVMPDEQGDLKLLNKYVNIHATGTVLLLAWISYTIAHAKVSTTNFVFLVLYGDQGSGKSTLCRIIQDLLDPNVVGVQTFPHSQNDLAIAAQNAHALFYDNLRSIKPLMADKLSIASTGGAMTGRQLYTNAEQAVLWLHVALVLNGIHSFIDQPDLAQRCLPLNLLSIDGKVRRSESVFIREFQADLPRIFRGLLDLIANIMVELPSVEPTNSERMIDFVHWLAAYEKVDNAPHGAYQELYSDALKESMLDSLLENPLAAAVMSFITEQKTGVWSGTPTDLLQELSLLVGNRSRYSQDWPQNPIALSKRLGPLQAALRRQGIDITLSRGRERKITITNMEAY